MLPDESLMVGPGSSRNSPFGRHTAGDILGATFYRLGGYAFGNSVHWLKLWHAPPHITDH